MNAEKYYFYTGTYCEKKDQGIYLVSADSKMNLEICGTTCAILPSYLHIDRKKKLLYAVSETENFEGYNGGSVICFKIKEDYKLEALNQLPTMGKLPCHLKTSADGKFLYAANYGEGTAVIYNMDKNGIPRDINMIINHTSTNKKSHIHFAGETPDGKYLCAVDLGLDCISFYDKANSFEKAFVFNTAEGSGPRQIKFSGDTAYILNENSSDIYALKYLSRKDKNLLPFKHIQTISALPVKGSEIHAAAEIKISRDGKYVFASVRFENGIAVFRRNPDGTLSKTDFAVLKGDCPRYFCVSPDGKYLLVGLEKLNEIAVYEFNEEKGTLRDAGKSLKIPSPVCFRFI